MLVNNNSAIFKDAKRKKLTLAGKTKEINYYFAFFVDNNNGKIVFIKND